ncbi:MAG: hypothetical protein GY927_15745, partial [bacterium]|nr:hypothetical protein [bacterium]
MPVREVTAQGPVMGLAFDRKSEEKKPEVDHGWVAPIGAAFRQENTVGSAIAHEAWRTPNDMDDGYDMSSDIVGSKYEPHIDKFVGIFNADRSAAIKRDIDKQEKDRRLLEESGMYGMANMMVAGFADPTILLPGGNLYKAVKAAKSAKTTLNVGKTAGSMAAWSAAGAGVAEIGLQATQQLRTKEESALTIGGAALTGGLIGRGLGKGFKAPRIA